jgi:hypothetical protein
MIKVLGLVIMTNKEWRRFRRTEADVTKLKMWVQLGNCEKKLMEATKKNRELEDRLKMYKETLTHLYRQLEGK